MHRRLATLAAAATLVLAATPSWATEKPDGTVEYTGGSVGAIVGVSFGRGVLQYQGKDYRFTANGITLGDVGASAAAATGKVYRLDSIDQFPGHYTAFQGGASFGGGVGGVTMRNQNDVVVQLGGVAVGFELSLGPAGVTITLDGPGTTN